MKEFNIFEVFVLTVMSRHHPDGGLVWVHVHVGENLVNVKKKDQKKKKSLSDFTFHAVLQNQHKIITA